jgi:hypothetical protein
MKTLLLIAACAISGLAWGAEQGAVVKVYSLDVQERMQNLELIDVTAQKPVSTEAETPDRELQAILDEVEALETE